MLIPEQVSLRIRHVLFARSFLEPNYNHRPRRPFAPFNREQHRENSALPRLFRRRGRADLHLVRERPAGRPVRFCWFVAGGARTSAKLNPQCLQRDLCLANLLKGALSGLPRLASSPTLLSVWNKGRWHHHGTHQTLPHRASYCCSGRLYCKRENLDRGLHQEARWPIGAS